MIDLNTIWYVLVGVLIAGYAVFDGFDLGVGVLSLLARNEKERRIHLKAIGPVWDGNEVWLLAAGGALFAAFPPVYATVFSGYYLALMLLLVALVFRAVSLEFFSQVDSPAWRRLWGWAFGLGSLLPSILFGVAFGNILRGLPISEKGVFTGTFLGLLNPYSLLVGLVSLAMFVMHGAIYMTLKTDGALRDRMQRWATGAWAAFAASYFLATLFALVTLPHLFGGLSANLLFYVALIPLLVGIAGIPRALGGSRYGVAFLASSATMIAMIALAGISLFPRLVPSRTNLAYSLTVYNASSTPRTLSVMLIVALIGMPLALAYTAWIYWIFRGKTDAAGKTY
jgi:cytochrome d ubiquinol oxidase subunit II